MVAVGGGSKRKIFGASAASADVVPKRLLKEQRPKKPEKPERLQKKKRAHLMREWLFQRRRRSSDQHRMIKENAVTESEYYFRFIRMSPCRFEHLLSLVGNRLMQKRTSIQDLMAQNPESQALSDKFCLERMSPAERLTITLRFLATGESQDSLSYSLGISEAVIQNIVSDTCMHLWETLSGSYVVPPKTTEDWIEISDQFYVISGMVHCLGAIDAKEIALSVPTNGTSAYPNYGKYYNLLLLTACDAHYCFTLVDIGINGTDDEEILNNSELGMRFEMNRMNVPEPEELHGCPMPELPYFLVGDEGFPLKHWLMKPYPGTISQAQKIFNWRISRVQRFIENSTGVLSARWRIYGSQIPATVEESQKYILSTIALHNYLMMTETSTYCPRGFVDNSEIDGVPIMGKWREIVAEDTNPALRPILNTTLQSRLDTYALSVRESLLSYFMREQAAKHKQEQNELARYNGYYATSIEPDDGIMSSQFVS